MSDDRELLGEFSRTGSEAAFRRLVECHLSLVYSAAMRLVNGDAHQAQDIAQLVFSNLARKARLLPPDVVLAGWLHRDTRFTALEWLRKEHRRIGREREAAAMNELESAGQVEWSQLRPVLDESLDELEDDDRNALLLRFFQQQSLAQLGRALGIAEDAARKRISRALERLRAALARRGIHSTTEALAGAFQSRAVLAVPAALAAAITSAALAGGTAAAATATWTASSLVTMTKIKLALAGAVLVGAVATPLVVQHQSETRLRQENLALRRQADERDKLSAENDRLKGLLADAGRRMPADEGPSRELLQLRSQVGMLRRDNEELARFVLDRQKKAAGAAPEADFRPSASWTDWGSATPEAAAGTFAWAVKTINTNRLAELLILPEAARTNTTSVARALTAMLYPSISKIQASRIVSVNNLAPDEVTLLFQDQIEGGDSQTSLLTLKLVDGHWKVKLPFSVEDQPGAILAK